MLAATFLLFLRHVFALHTTKQGGMLKTEGCSHHGK